MSMQPMHALTEDLLGALKLFGEMTVLGKSATVYQANTRKPDGHLESGARLGKPDGVLNIAEVMFSSFLVPSD